MNFICNPAQKYVPNDLFKNKVHCEAQNYINCKRQEKQSHQNHNFQLNTRGKSRRSVNLFKDVSNFIQSNKSSSLKSKQCIFTENNYSKSNSDQHQEQKIQPTQQDSCKERRKRPKKKISPKKNYFKNIMVEFNDDSQSQKCQQKVSEIPQKQRIEQLNNLQKCQRQQAFQKQQKSPIKQDRVVESNINDRFYKEILFESSQQEERIENKRSSQSSENEFAKIGLILPKNNKKMFLEEAYQFQSQSSKEQVINDQNQLKETQTVQQVSQKIQKQPTKSQTQITITQFRRQHILEDQEYLKKPLPQYVTIQFILKRDKSKRKSDFVQYYLHDSKTLKQLVVVRKSSDLEIYAKQHVQNIKAHPEAKYLTAKVQSSFLGSQFNLKYLRKNYSKQQNLAATITYQTNILGLNGPRKMNVFIPQNETRKINVNKNLQTLYKEKNKYKISKFTNKQAIWNKQVQSYVLNLKGKAKVSSVKNFIIVKDKQTSSPENPKNHVIFGKINKDIFNLVIGGPFSILQGLSIALSTFDRKFACQ